MEFNKYLYFTDQFSQKSSSAANPVISSHDNNSFFNEKQSIDNFDFGDDIQSMMINVQLLWYVQLLFYL